LWSNAALAAQARPTPDDANSSCSCFFGHAGFENDSSTHMCEIGVLFGQYNCFYDKWG
jgi:hypothetical protein